MFLMPNLADWFEPCLVVANRLRPLVHALDFTAHIV